MELTLYFEISSSFFFVLCTLAFATGGDVLVEAVELVQSLSKEGPYFWFSFEDSNHDCVLS